MSFTVVSYYTPEYAEEARRLQSSVDSLGISAVIDGFPSRGSWIANCAKKPEFIRFQAEMVGAVLWIDADAEVLGDLSLIDGTRADFAVRKRSGAVADRCGPFMSGTLYFSGPQPILDEWVAQQDAHPEVWDQKTLHWAWERSRPDTMFLPKTYCQKFDESGENAVIVHHQASRRLSGVVNKQQREHIRPWTKG